jgi:hypothetical protein
VTLAGPLDRAFGLKFFEHWHPFRMTFVLALGNCDQVIQISDRKLTDARGNPCVLPENKATILTLPHGRLLVGFAGLARAGSFRTGIWIPEALAGAGKAANHELLGTVERFTEAVATRFREPDLQAVPRRHRALSILFTGYNDYRPPPNLIAAWVTNFQNLESRQDEEPWEDFKVTRWWFKPEIPAEEATYIQRIGAWLAMDDNRDRADFRQMLEERRSADAIINAAVGRVREMAARPAAEGRIGRELSAAIVPAPRPAGIERGEFPLQFGFHPEGASDVLLGVSEVVSLPGMEAIIGVPEFRDVGPEGSRPTWVQKVGRNKPCPCGSGRKYKHCHGR